jgi:hypothetical protein
MASANRVQPYRLSKLLPKHRKLLTRSRKRSAGREAKRIRCCDVGAPLQTRFCEEIKFSARGQPQLSLPVTNGPLSCSPPAEPPPSTSSADETISIEVGATYLIRVGANFDCATLRRVLDCLGRAGGAREKGR